MRALKPVGIDYPRFWRRALLAATAARSFGEAAKVTPAEDIFLAGLLQDMAVLAIDRAWRDFYAKLKPLASHSECVEYEKQHLGKDHAPYTAMLLKSWNLPGVICDAVKYSHDPQAGASDDGRRPFCALRRARQRPRGGSARSGSGGIPGGPGPTGQRPPQHEPRAAQRSGRPDHEADPGN